MSYLLAFLFKLFVVRGITHRLADAEYRAYKHVERISPTEWRRIEQDIVLNRTMLKHLNQAKTLADAREYHEECNVCLKALNDRVNRAIFTKAY